MPRMQPSIIPIAALDASGNTGTQARVAEHACREGCAACCIAPSISSPIPGMPDGKPAGVACVQLTADLRCAIFGQPERPQVCSSLAPSPDMCGENREQALRWLGVLETATQPNEPNATATPAGLVPGQADPEPAPGRRGLRARPASTRS